MIQLTTNRLLIRDHSPADLQTHHELFSNAKTMWYLQDIMTHSMEESQENLQLALSQIDDPKRQFYFLRMEERATHAHIGEIGYTVSAFTPQGKMVDVGYFIREPYWGQSLTTEAFQEIIRFAFEEDGVYRISCGCLRENVGSERVMQKCGMILEAHFKEYQLHDGRLKDRMVYRLLRSEWEQGKRERATDLDKSTLADTYATDLKPCHSPAVGVALCLEEQHVQALLVNSDGDILEATRLDVPADGYEAAIFPFLDRLIAQREVKGIGIGAPGVMEGTHFLRKNHSLDGWHTEAIGARISQRYGLPTMLENDLNATTVGFWRCYQNEFPGENPSDANMAYLHFDRGCISAGLIANGQLLRGHRHFAGELGLVPLAGGRLLDEMLSSPPNDRDFVALASQLVGWVCGMLNPQYVAVGGSSFPKDCLAAIGDSLSGLLPGQMCPELLYAPDIQHDYYNGLAYLTAVHLFGDVPFVKRSYGLGILG